MITIAWWWKKGKSIIESGSMSSWNTNTVCIIPKYIFGICMPRLLKPAGNQGKETWKWRWWDCNYNVVCVLVRKEWSIHHGCSLLELPLFCLFLEVNIAYILAQNIVKAYVAAWFQWLVNINIIQLAVTHNNRCIFTQRHESKRNNT